MNESPEKEPVSVWRDLFEPGWRQREAKRAARFLGAIPLAQPARTPDGVPIIQPLPEPPPRPADGAVAQCGLCGLRLQPVMGYVCPRLDCPCFPHVTC